MKYILNTVGFDKLQAFWTILCLSFIFEQVFVCWVDWIILIWWNMIQLNNNIITHGIVWKPEPDPDPGPEENRTPLKHGPVRKKTDFEN